MLYTSLSDFIFGGVLKMLSDSKRLTKWICNYKIFVLLEVKSDM